MCFRANQLPTRSRNLAAIFYTFLNTNHHILPRCEGGSDEVDNLHLLCKECHLESETLSGDVYWQWLQSKNYSNSGSFLRVWNKTKIIQSLYEQKKFDLLPPDVLVGINNFLNTQK